MPYVLVRESFLCISSTVEGLPSNEARILAEKCCTYPELREEKQRRLDFNIPSLPILNSLEQLGYKVVSSGSFVASQVILLRTYGTLLIKQLFREEPINLFKKNLFGLCTEAQKICLMLSVISSISTHH